MEIEDKGRPRARYGALVWIAGRHQIARALVRGLGSGWVVAAVAVAGCAGSAPPGSSCSASSECESGLACLYPLGSGCGASGQCAIPLSDCSGSSSAGLVLCGCGGAVLDLACIPSSLALPQRTATGAACSLDGGADAGDAAR
jgi:hypothetical protein